MMKLPPEIEIWSGQAKKHASDPLKGELIQSLEWLGEHIFRQIVTNGRRNPRGFQGLWAQYGGKQAIQTP
jgi:hypothetical protein